MPMSYMTLLTEAISDQRATFYCGGTIPISTDGQPRFSRLGHKIPSLPVTLRWSLPSGEPGQEVTFPSSDEASKINGLLHACDPATFGKDGKDILDESYRNAAKLDESQFSTNFNPYEVGIVDAVSQTLLPGVAKPLAGGKTKSGEALGVIAELYKLNIYSGPSGKFKAHVDTPRSPTQFGSLVVCLPHPHQGGRIRVRHQGVESQWDWSNEKPSAVEWVAFYSDCEHEVFEVTSGHRVTLTYNLYVYERIGGIIRDSQSDGASFYPLFGIAQKALMSSSFMDKGGKLGFYCRHSYAHTIKPSPHPLPYALKGADAVFYMVYKRLGLYPYVRPVICIDDALCENVYEDENEFRDDYDPENPFVLIGRDFHSTALMDECAYEEETKGVLKRGWKSDWEKDITWLNEPGPKELATVHMAYGNEASLEYHYSAAAILVTIPPRDQR